MKSWGSVSALFGHSVATTIVESLVVVSQIILNLLFIESTTTCRGFFEKSSFKN